MPVLRIRRAYVPLTRTPMGNPPAPARPRDGGAIELPCGGRLGVAQYGLPDGRPIFYFHGFPGSRLEASLADRLADGLGIRIVAFDRPGIGLSTFRRERTITDISRDTELLADALGIGRFSVLGVSGGAPYALACGIRLPARVTRIGLVCPVGPFSDLLYRPVLGWKLNTARSLSVHSPSWFRWILRKATGTMMSDPEGFLLRLAGHAGSPDREVILSNRTLLAANLREAFRDGEAGAVRDAELLFRPWGFHPSDAAQSVFLWHGGRDRTVPQGVGYRLAGEIPRCRSFFPRDEGHFSLPIGRAEEIFTTLDLAESREGA